MFLILSRELISRTDNWKTPKLGTVADQNLAIVSKTVLEIFEIRSPSYFFTAFPRKKRSILQKRNV